MSDENEKSDAARWYDTEIAPVLGELQKKCDARNVPFVAVVEYEPEKVGRTFLIPPRASLAMEMLYLCAKTGDNFDAYVMNLRRHAKANNIDTKQSIIMGLIDRLP